MPFYSDQAKQFLQLAQNTQTRIDKAGTSMNDNTRSALEDKRDGLIEQANQMLLDDIQATLSGLSLDQPRLAACTQNLNNAVKVVQDFNRIVAIAQAGLDLVTACVSGNPLAIVTAIACAEKAIAAAQPSNVAVMPSAITGLTADASGIISTIAASGTPGGTGS